MVAIHFSKLDVLKSAFDMKSEVLKRINIANVNINRIKF